MKKIQYKKIKKKNRRGHLGLDNLVGDGKFHTKKNNEKKMKYNTKKNRRGHLGLDNLVGDGRPK